MTTASTSRKTRLSAVLLLMALALTVQAGPLEPPVPPGNPTMMPIDRVDPRIPVYAGDLPLTITQPGSYYLAEDIDANGGAGIFVATTDVTIDLMGFSLANGTGPAIDGGGQLRITVKNGRILGWSGTGVLLGHEVIVSNVIAKLNGGSGISVGNDALVVRCISSSNYVHGIVAATGSIVQECASSNNHENGIWASTAVGEHGILIRDSVVDFNLRNGIRVDGRAFVLNNQCRSNGFDTSDKAGIWVNGDGNRIEGNHVVGNKIGIDISGNDNVIARNTMQGSGTQNWHLAPSATGNLFEVWTSAAPGPPGPWDNIDQ